MEETKIFSLSALVVATLFLMSPGARAEDEWFRKNVIHLSGCSTNFCVGLIGSPEATAPEPPDQYPPSAPKKRDLQFMLCPVLPGGSCGTAESCKARAVSMQALNRSESSRKKVSDQGNLEGPDTNTFSWSRAPVGFMLQGCATSQQYCGGVQEDFWTKSGIALRSGYKYDAILCTKPSQQGGSSCQDALACGQENTPGLSFVKDSSRSSVVYPSGEVTPGTTESFGTPGL